MASVLRFTARYVVERIELQYAAALSKAESYIYEASIDEVIIHGVSRTHRFNTKSRKRGCDFANSMRLLCCHAIVYSRHSRFPGQIILWHCINNRWTSSVTKLQPVEQLAYQVFDGDAFTTVISKPCTHYNRYKEVARVTHLIASELTDIFDAKYFYETLSFILHQWRNVRQIKSRVGKATRPVTK
ncbi:hypothetical protein AM587_10009815 [Phytophthora nicotianae]|uniref:Uncharacterized protein n=1 Tax=Phytophthora nicotianae TaxID=4792 RepID=A0A0W8DR59_PHYNI|nr:hypothetical protein AM587_10009815 [Phytophthora nicotianae]